MFTATHDDTTTISKRPTASRHALPIAGAAHAPPSGADAQLIADAADFMAHQARVKATETGALHLSEDEHGVFGTAWYAALERVTEITPRTKEGRAAEIAVAHAALASTGCHPDIPLQREEQCALVVLAELLGSPAI